MSDEAVPDRANPAAELLEIFLEWANAPGSTNLQRRDPTTREGLITHVRAMNLVQETISAIDALEADGRNVRVYRAYQDAWVQAVLILGTGNWTSGTSPSSDFPIPMTDALEALADVIEHRPGVNQAEAALIGLLLDEVLAATRETDLDPRLVSHITKVVNRLREYMHDFAHVSPEAASEAWEAAWAAASAAVAQTTGEERKRWERIRDSFVLPTASGFLASAPSLVLQITQMASGGAS